MIDPELGGNPVAELTEASRRTLFDMHKAITVTHELADDREHTLEVGHNFTLGLQYDPLRVEATSSVSESGAMQRSIYVGSLGISELWATTDEHTPTARRQDVLRHLGGMVKGWVADLPLEEAIWLSKAWMAIDHRPDELMQVTAEDLIETSPYPVSSSTFSFLSEAATRDGPSVRYTRHEGNEVFLEEQLSDDRGMQGRAVSLRLVLPGNLQPVKYFYNRDHDGRQLLEEQAPYNNFGADFSAENPPDDLYFLPTEGKTARFTTALEVANDMLQARRSRVQP